MVEVTKLGQGLLLPCLGMVPPLPSSPPHHTIYCFSPSIYHKRATLVSRSPMDRYYVRV